MQRYLETRTTNASHITTAAADVARHLLPRQHLGKVVVVCDKPIITISVLRKSWLKLSRSLQRERASTLNAEKILHLTHDITHMQHMNFVTKPPQEYPQADVFFVTPEQLDYLPSHCQTIYVLQRLVDEQVGRIIPQLPERGLVVDYTNNLAPTDLLRPKRDLEALLPAAWQRVEQFMDIHHIDMQHVAANLYNAMQVDDTIDAILNTSRPFLTVAGDFLELLQLCQPAHTTAQQQRLYDMISVLHRRISALTPGILSQQFTQNFGDDDFGLHDSATENMALALAVL